MGKRSNGFERIEKNFYRTIDLRAGKILEEVFRYKCIPSAASRYYEPCCGSGDLIENLAVSGTNRFQCVGKSDISDGKDALDLSAEDIGDCDFIITNPPWSRGLLHEMIMHFKNLKPTYLLFDADWSMNKSSVPFMEYCHGIYPIGRLKWIPGTTMQSKDNCAWYLFDKHLAASTEFKNLRG